MSSDQGAGVRIKQGQPIVVAKTIGQYSRARTIRWTGRPIAGLRAPNGMRRRRRMRLCTRRKRLTPAYPFSDVMVAMAKS